MLLFYLGQVPAQWFTEAGDAALAGGILRFYEVGTSTPKAVYSDYQGVTAAGTSVTLDASGRANVFLDGLYSVTLEDSDNVQIGPKIDGVGNAALVGDGYTLTLLNYDDLRGFDGDSFRSVVLQGRIANGDGGAGLFVWDALETSADDGGTILAPTTLPASGRWVRIRGETVDPRWYGCAMDGATADDAEFAIAVAAAVALKARLHLENGYLRLTSNFSFPSGSNVSTGNGAGLTATSGTPTLTFTSTKFSGSPGCFAGTIQPIFASIDVAEIPLSWMGGSSNDAMLDKWAASIGVAGQKHVLDKSISGIIPSFSSGAILDIVPGSLWTVNATGQSLSVDVVYLGDAQWMNWGAIANIGAVDIGDRACPVSWFGAAGDYTTDDTIPLHAAMKSGWMRLGVGIYKYNADVTVSHLRVDGLISVAHSVGQISSTATSMPASALAMGDGYALESTGEISFENAGFYANGSGGGISTTGNFGARNCVIGCWDSALIEASEIDAQDCYANSETVFSTTDDATTFYSSLRTNAEVYRYTRKGTTFSDVYLLNEIGKSSQYDILLTADNDTGEIIGKTEFSPEKITTRYLVENGIEDTTIRFHWFDNLGTPTCEVYRDEILVATFANDPAYYTIQAIDDPVILVKIEGWTSGWPSTSVLPSASKPSNSVRNTIVNTTPTVSICYVGEVSPVHMHNTARLALPSPFGGNIVAQGIWTGLNWAYSA